MNLAIFDLDKTLVKIDTADAWSNYICELGLINNIDQFKAKNCIYESQYDQGTLNMRESVEFNLKPLIHINLPELRKIINKFISKKIIPNIYSTSYEVIKKHQQNGDLILLISATVEELVIPIGEILGFDYQNIIAIKTTKNNNQLTGKTNGIISFREGKVECLQAWLKIEQIKINRTYFYSDSHNDLALLEYVDHPIATNPSKKLEAIAKQKKWEILHLR